jgi:hypothetical protein
MEWDDEEPDWMTTGWFTPKNEANLCKQVGDDIVTVFYKNGSYAAAWNGHFSERFSTQEAAMRAAERLVELWPVKVDHSDDDVEF